MLWRSGLLLWMRRARVMGIRGNGNDIARHGDALGFGEKREEYDRNENGALQHDGNG